MEKEFGLLAVGNALVDILSHVGDDFISQQGMNKGAGTMVDEARARGLHALTVDPTYMSGGSTANSVSCFASFGGKGAFIGKAGDDELGAIFRTDMQSQGIHYTVLPAVGQEETGRVYVYVTPDHERTMNAYLGANTRFSVDDVDEGLIARSRIVLFEGYRYDYPSGRDVIEKIMDLAQKHGTKTAFTLSDYRLVARYRAQFNDLAARVDILHANEKECKALTLAPDFNAAADILRRQCACVAATLGPQGALILTPERDYPIAPVPSNVVDTTGAGDAFAGGFLFGVSRGMDLAAAGTLGAKAASHTISHIGARQPGMKFSQFLPA